MGRKANQIAEELRGTQDELERERARSTQLRNQLNTALVRAEPQGEDTALLRENDELRQRLAEFEDAPAQGIRLVTDGRGPEAWSTRAKITKALGIDVPDGAEASDDIILEVIHRLKGPTSDGEEGAMVKRNESLADAVLQNKGERAKLADRLQAADGIVNRLAATLQVDRWGPDGAEIVEKAQRFSTFHYWLKKRLLAIGDPNRDLNRERAEAVTLELRTVIAALVGDAQLAKLIQTKPVAVSKTILDLAENRPPAETWRFEPGDFHKIESALDKVALDVEQGAAPVGIKFRVRELADLFLQLHASAVNTDLVEYINLVVVPALARLKASTKPKGN